MAILRDCGSLDLGSTPGPGLRKKVSLFYCINEYLISRIFFINRRVFWPSPGEGVYHLCFLVPYLKNRIIYWYPAAIQAEYPPATLKISDIPERLRILQAIPDLIPVPQMTATGLVVLIS